MNTTTWTERMARAARTGARSLGSPLSWLVLSALLATLPTPAAGVDYNDFANGNWSTPGTWNVVSGYPSGTDDTATIDGTRAIDVDVSVAIGSLTVTGNHVQTLNATTPNTLTVNTFSSGNINNFTIGAGLSLNIAGTGQYITRGGTVNGTLNVLNGATLTYTIASQSQTGTGTVHVASGGKVVVNNNSTINTATIDNDGQVEIDVVGTATFGGTSITGDGEWKVSSGTLLFNQGSYGQTITLAPATAKFTSSTGTVHFNRLAAGPNTLGAFDMSGTNMVRIAPNGGTIAYEINRNSTFQNLDIGATNAFSTQTLDLAPNGGGAKTHTVNGTLSRSSNTTATFSAGDAGGATLNVANFVNNSVAYSTTIGSGVTLNLTGVNHTQDGLLNILGAVNVKSGATLSHINNRRLYGNGAFTIESGGTYDLLANSFINESDGGATGMTVTNNGLVVANNTGTFNVRAKEVKGTGTWKVNDTATTGGLTFGNNTTVEGWNGSTTFDSLATWHIIGSSRSINLPNGSNNSITSIGEDATIIIENGGRIVELNSSARNNLTVDGALHVRGSSILAFNANQTLTVASGGTLGGDGTISTSGTGQILVQSGGTLSPGNSIGTLNITGALTLAGTVAVELGTPGANPALGIADLTAVTGDLSLAAGTSALHLIDNAGADGNGSAAAGHYRLITFDGSRTGELTTVTNDTSYLAKVVYNGDANGSVDLELWDHGVASFASDSILTSLTLDFGEVAGGSGSHSLAVDLYNLLQTAGLTAGLDMTWLLTSSDAAPLSTDLAALDNLAGGGSQGFLAFLNANLGVGVFSETYQLSFIDNTTGFYGTANPAQILTLTLTGTVLLIPEPASLALLAAGGLLAGCRRRK